MKQAQLVVLEQLLAGQTITDAAEAAGVGRSTVHRWLKEDFEFRARFNSERRRLHERLCRRLTAMGDQAVGCVEKALGDGDIRTALAVLKGLGVLNGQVPDFGDESPGQLRAAAGREAFKVSMNLF